MAAYKDKSKGTWYVSFYYQNWKGERERKLKRGFGTKREALEWELEFKKSRIIIFLFGNFTTFELIGFICQAFNISNMCLSRQKENTFLTVS